MNQIQRAYLENITGPIDPVTLPILLASFETSDLNMAINHLKPLIRGPISVDILHEIALNFDYDYSRSFILKSLLPLMVTHGQEADVKYLASTMAAGQFRTSFTKSAQHFFKQNKAATIINIVDEEEEQDVTNKKTTRKVGTKRKAPVKKTPAPKKKQKTTQKKEEEKTAAITCVICLDKAPCIVMVDCHHLCLCESCIEHYKEKMDCPICRCKNTTWFRAIMP